MPDILSQGGDHQPSPWPRRVASAVVLVLVAVLIVTHLPRSSHSSASARATPTVTPSTASGAAQPASTVLVPDGITGPVLSWPDGLRLPATGRQPAWFLPGTGLLMQIGGLPPVRSGYEFIRAGDGWAIQAGPVSQRGCGTCAGPPRAVYFLAGGAQSATRVGLADAVAPAADGRLWLTGYPPDADPRTAVGTAREVSTTGTPPGPQLRLPAGYQIEQSIQGGLLLAAVAPRPGASNYQIWDPATRHPGRTFSTVLAASATQIASTPQCAADCPLQVLNLATGRQISLDLPPGRSAVNAAFSPDGRFLAMELSFSNEGDDGGQAVQLVVLSTDGGHLMAVPETSLSSDALISFGWPAVGDSLVAELGFTTKVQLMSWRPGAAQLAVAALRPLHPASLVIAQSAPSAGTP